MLDVAAVGDGRGQADVQFHEEVRAHLEVGGLGRVGDLQPRRDATDPGGVDLDDAGRTTGQVLAELSD